MFCTREDSLEVELTNRPGTVRTEFTIQDIAMLVHANCSQRVDEVTAAGGFFDGRCEDRRLCSEWQQALPELNLLLISS
jgi:hypothetical protein